MPRGIYVRTIEIRRRISKTLSGRKREPFTKEHKKKIGDANRGKKCTEETKKKISKAKKGNVLLQKTKDKISKANKGKKKPPRTKEHCRRIGLGNKGKKVSEETKRKVRNAIIKRDGFFKKGKDNINWKDGKSFEEYPKEFNNKLKEQVRGRDNYECQECRMIQGKYKLSVHHIDYDKKNNNPNNLITLCRKCHIKTNYNREDWIKYYKYKIKINGI